MEVSLIGLVGSCYEPSALESCVVTGVTVASSDQSGLPAIRSARILKFAKFVIPKAMRLIIDALASIGHKGTVPGQDLIVPAFQGSPK